MAQEAVLLHVHILHLMSFHKVRLESSSTGSSFPADFTKSVKIWFAVVRDEIRCFNLSLPRGLPLTSKIVWH